MTRRNADILAALARSPLLDELARSAGYSPDEVRRALGHEADPSPPAPAPPPPPTPATGRLVIHVDGASRGNPGLAAAGIAIDDERGAAVLHRGEFLGRATNNEAEYRALIIALGHAQELGASRVSVRSDSELMVHQVNGRYRVKEPRLQVLHAEVMAGLRRFPSFEVAHVRREQNQVADGLANLAIDEYISRRDAKGSKSAG